jgi:TRAP-type mannitol/chloroaromatic compound transport system substrate-binding protein
MAQTAPYYFTGKDAIFAFGCAVPFGLNARQMDACMEHGNGRKLMDAFYAKYNMRSFSSGNTGTQMGGWYRKEIKTVKDLKGLKMRMGGGLFGEAMAKLGVVSQNMPAGDVYSALEKGTLDATEFVGPYDDEKLGFNKVAPFYYYPGWWEGGAELEFFVNTKAYDALSAENKAILEAATKVAARDMTAKYDAVNPIALKRLVAAKTQLRPFSKELMDAGYKASMEVFAEHEAKSPEFKNIHQDMRAFQRDQILWTRFSEYRFDSYMSSVKL